ncbi:DNA alkylation repair protein [Levilactobacillus bambusae]|uniref:6-O-methylguanine DNA methyltransferase n=1 Tax=Levilactobacillus bambusae TaxID=2024736 RepID=A0A2V1N006_9LACO|nr:DNA alkylation repair protein [Levilactobacillus bambusae]PWG00353.1 6-O-methylguanine DNA methyltransferase [Levilactobacillus bambusae]
MFQLIGEAQNQVPMAKYMKDQFPFVGVKSVSRRQQSKPLITKSKTLPIADLQQLIADLYARTEREYQYVAIDMALANVRRFTLDNMWELKPYVTTKAWWDSVDSWRKVYTQFILRHPESTREVFDWFFHPGADSSAVNLWERRVAITLQLLMKDQLNRHLLTTAIEAERLHDEFFIQKAIGWSLRDYSKTDPAWVRQFIVDHQLSPLAVKEGSKYL